MNLSPAGRLLIIIDVQRGFLNQTTEHIPEIVTELQARFDHVIATRFINPEGSSYRKLIGWERFAPGSDDTNLAFDPRPDATVIDKAAYSCLTPEVTEFLEKEGVTDVHLAGIATDNCVLKTAVDLFEAGYRPVVVADACASHGGDELHDCGIKLLRRFIGSDQVIGG